MRKRIAAAGLTIVLMFGLIAGAGRQIAEESERDIKEFTAFLRRRERKCILTMRFRI